MVETAKSTKDIGLGLTANITVDKESGKIIASAIKSSASNIGICETICAIAEATASVVKSSSIPTSAKVAYVVESGFAGGLVHAGVTAANRILTNSNDTTQNDNQEISEPSSPTDNFSPASPYEIDIISKIFYNDNSVEVLIYTILALNIISLLLLINLAFLFIYKYYFNSNIELKFIDKILPQPYNLRVISIIKRYLALSSKLSLFNILWALFIIIFCNIFSIYFLNVLVLNFELICKLYLKYIIK